VREKVDGSLPAETRQNSSSVKLSIASVQVDSRSGGQAGWQDLLCADPDINPAPRTCLRDPELRSRIAGAEPSLVRSCWLARSPVSRSGTDAAKAAYGRPVPVGSPAARERSSGVPGLVAKESRRLRRATRLGCCASAFRQLCALGQRPLPRAAFDSKEKVYGAPSAVLWKILRPACPGLPACRRERGMVWRWRGAAL
jgi:hypothetical protein